MTTLREAAQQALEALHEIAWSNDSRWQTDRAESVIPTLRDALAQQTKTPCDIAEDGVCEVIDCCRNPAQEEQEPVACFIGAKGGAFDLPTTKRAYTYAEQPGNVIASKLGRSLETAKRCSAGDSIDAGLVLLKALQAEGFGVFQLGAEYTAPPRCEWQGLTEEEIIEAVRESDLDWHRGWTLEDGESNRYTKLACTLDGVLKEKNHG